MQMVETNPLIVSDPVNVNYSWSYDADFDKLDHSFPAPTSNPATIFDSSGNAVTNPLLNFGNGVFTFEDTPNDDLSLNEPLPGYGNQGSPITSFDESAFYSTYVMFLPPGANSQWVPVAEVVWHWGVDVTEGTAQNGSTVWQYASKSQPVVLDTFTKSIPRTEPIINGVWQSGVWELA